MDDETNDPPEEQSAKQRELSSTPAAIRARRYRSRKKIQRRGVFLPLNETDQGNIADFLIDQNKLAEWDAEDADAVGIAVAAFLKDLTDRA